MSSTLQASKHDCTAHSALYSPGGNNVKPLFVYTDTWCSSGQFDANGMLVQTGGDADGVSKVIDNINRLWIELQVETIYESPHAPKIRRN